MKTRVIVAGSNDSASALRFFKATVLIGFFAFAGISPSRAAESSPSDGGNQDSGCPAFDALVDQVSSSAQPDAGQLAVLAGCVIKQASSDNELLSGLSVAVSNLAASGQVSAGHAAAVNALVAMAPGNQATGAASFFAAGALVRAAEAARLFDSPTSKSRAQDVYGAIADFAQRARNRLGGTAAAEDALIISAGGSLAAEMNQISLRVNRLSKEAAIVARRDMAASVALRAKTAVRQGLGNGSAAEMAGAIATLDSLFTEANEYAFRAGAELATNDSVAADDWMASFDRRTLDAVHQISPETAGISEALESWHAGLREKHGDMVASSAEASSPGVLVDLAPDQMRSELFETTEALRRVIPEVRKEIEKSSGVIDRSAFGHTSSSLAALNVTDQVLVGAGLRLRRLTSPDELLRAWEARHLMKLLVTWTLEASAAKSRTAPRLVEVLTLAMRRLTEAGSTFLRMEDLHELHGIIEDQNSENWVRAFVNRRMAVVYAQSAILLGEAIAVPFTFGGSSAAMPATLHAIVVGLQVAGKATLVVTSSLNIADRYVQDGVKGLVNPASALDALTIVMLMPRPIPGPVDAQSWFGRALQSARNRTAGWMHDAGRLAVAGHAAFGAYQLAFAGHIAGTLRQQGYQVSEAEIRIQALAHFGQAFLLGVVEWGEYRRGQALGGDHFNAVMSASNPIKAFARRLRNMVFPHEAAINTFNSLAPVIGKPLAGAAAIVPAAAYVAYDYVIASEAMMYFYAGSDYGYFAHNRQHADYPELAPGETAVTFIGFDEADMLYAGAHSVDAHMVETSKYGSRYFVYDYRSRDEFLKRLEQHARDHGPVKYLRIMTHGLPGKLYTGDVANSAAVDDTDGASDTAQRDGWIDAGWMRANGDRIRQIAAASMAPGARAVLFACLVGANLDKAAPGIAQDAGDDFLRAMGETLLSRGGLIDSSVRFLIGMDTVYGGLLNWSARDEAVRNARSTGHNPVLPVQLFRSGTGGMLERDDGLRDRMAEAVLAAASGDGIVAAESDWAKSSEMLQYAAARLWRMVTQLHKLGIRYGIQLEGPWWSTPRFKHAVVVPVAGALGADAVKVTITTH